MTKITLRDKIGFVGNAILDRVKEFSPGKINPKKLGILGGAGTVLVGSVTPAVAGKLSISANGTYDNAQGTEVPSIWHDFSNRFGQLRFHDNIKTSEDTQAPADKVGIDINLPKNSGAFVYTKGHVGGNDKIDAGLWTKQPVGRAKIFGDVEVVGENGQKPVGFAMTGFYSDRLYKNLGVSGELAALWQKGNETDKDLEGNVLGWVAGHNDHVYGALAKGASIRQAYLGLYGNKDFGLHARAEEDKESGEWYVKLKGSVEGANQGFFSLDNFDVATSYLSLGRWFPIHFSPFMNVGNLTYKGEVVSDKDGNVQYTAEIGKQLNSLVQVGAGVDVLASKEKGTKKAGLVYEAAVKIPLGKGLSITADGNGNTRNGVGSLYLNACKTF